MIWFRPHNASVTTVEQSQEKKRWLIQPREGRRSKGERREGGRYDRQRQGGRALNGILFLQLRAGGDDLRRALVGVTLEGLVEHAL